MKKIIMALTITFAVSAFSAQAHAQAEQFSNADKQVLAIAEFTGYCSSINDMVAFQQSAKIQNSDQFVAAFLNAKAAQSGNTVSQYIAQCQQALTEYSKVK